MKILNHSMAVCLLFATVLLSCSKSSGPSTVTPTSYSSIDEIFAMLSVQPKTLAVDVATGGSFYGNSGTRYIFYPNSFQTATGADVTGTVQIQVSEYLQKGDMLFSKMLPISNGEPLISGGEINVVATQNGQPVYLKPHNFFQANIPQAGTAPTGMAFFSGEPVLDTTQFKVNWIQPALDSSHYAASMIAAIKADTTKPAPQRFDSLAIISDSLRMCNADMFMVSPHYQVFTVTITVAENKLPDVGQIFAYTLYDTYKGIWPLAKYGYANGVYSEYHVPNIPVHFAIFTLIGGQFYGGILGATPATGTNYTVTLTQQDPAAFKASINQL